MGLMLLLFLLPMAVVLYKYTTQSLRSSVRDAQQKTAAQLAIDVVTDYMRQFSQDPYNGHYDSASLSRPVQDYANGFSTVTFTADPANHNVYLLVTAGYGTISKPLTTKTVDALIHFQAPLTQYGTMLDGSTTLSASGVSYDGGFWVNGNFTESGANVTWNGGPVVVNGNFSGASGDAVDGDLYYGGSSVSGVTVTGRKVNYVPSITWPTLDFTYYSAYATFVTTSNASIVFNSTQTFSVVNGQTYAIPSSGAIIFADNANLTIKGAVSAPVTVVAGSSTNGNCSSSQGKITVADNVYYVGASSVSASASADFAALASNCITFSKSSNADMVVAGVYFVQNGTNNMQTQCSTCHGKRFELFGTRTQAISLSGFSSSVISYDPMLRSYQPPGLPEQAYLVRFHLR